MLNWHLTFNCPDVYVSVFVSVHVNASLSVWDVPTGFELERSSWVCMVEEESPQGINLQSFQMLDTHRLGLVLD